MSWTVEQEQKLAEMYASNTPVRVIAKLLGKSNKSIYQKAWRLNLGDPERQQIAVKRRRVEPAYAKGKEARRQGRAISIPDGNPVERSWWLAGWHDKDMELGHSVIAERMEGLRA